MSGTRLGRTAPGVSQLGGHDHDAAQYGFRQALPEGRLPLEMVHDRPLEALHTGRFRTLILPNAAALPEAQCRQLKSIVQNGGGLAGLLARFSSGASANACRTPT